MNLSQQNMATSGSVLQVNSTKLILLMVPCPRIHNMYSSYYIGSISQSMIVIEERAMITAEKRYSTIVATILCCMTYEQNNMYKKQFNKYITIYIMISITILLCNILCFMELSMTWWKHSKILSAYYLWLSIATISHCRNFQSAPIHIDSKMLATVGSWCERAITDMNSDTNYWTNECLIAIITKNKIHLRLNYSTDNSIHFNGL